MSREEIAAFLGQLTFHERMRLASIIGVRKDHLSNARSMAKRKRRNQFLCPNYAIDKIREYAVKYPLTTT